ncbi:MAG TPA: tripartite tricarboxylate transporter substrate-binding protein [Burkholderiaceae bacterium]|nr:tripartite tricarboxylate transporter substrate-binding protein [Burkholderiaceae bacterium]
MAQLVLAVHLSGRTYEPSIGDPGYLRLLTPQRKPIVDKFHAEAVKALSSPEVKKQLEEQLGMRLVLSTPDEMASFVDGEMAKWSRIIRENDIRLD